MQVIAQEIQGFVNNLAVLLIKECISTIFLKRNGNKGLEEFGAFFEFKTV